MQIIIENLNILKPNIIYHLEIKCNDIVFKKCTSKSSFENDLNKICNKNFKERKTKLIVNCVITILSEHGKSFD